MRSPPHSPFKAGEATHHPEDARERANVAAQVIESRGAVRTLTVSRRARELAESIFAGGTGDAIKDAMFQQLLEAITVPRPFFSCLMFPPVAVSALPPRSPGATARLYEWCPFCGRILLHAAAVVGVAHAEMTQLEKKRVGRFLVHFSVSRLPR